jgi:hypothetical protein
VYIDCVCGFEFESESIPFTILYFSQSMLCFIFTYVLAPLSTLKLNLLFFLGVIPLGLFAWWFYWLTFDHIDDKD